MGTAVQTSPSLADLVKPVVDARQPARPRSPRRDDRRQVRVSGPHASFSVDVVADPGVPAGSAWLPVNVAADDARSLIDPSGPVTDVRIENV